MTSNNSATNTLYDRLGGDDAVKAVVEDFYNRLLQDDRLARFFEGQRVERLRAHQLRFLKMAFTEIPKDVDVAELILKKHLHLFEEHGLNETHFDLVASHLVDALKGKKVDDVLISEAAGIVLSLRGVFEEGARKYGGGIGRSKTPVEAHPADEDADAPPSGVFETVKKYLAWW